MAEQDLCIILEGQILEIAIDIAVKAVVKTGCHTILYNGPPQRQGRGPRCSILFTGVPYSPITTVYVGRNMKRAHNLREREHGHKIMAIRV